MLRFAIQNAFRKRDVLTSANRRVAECPFHGLLILEVSSSGSNWQIFAQILTLHFLRESPRVATFSNLALLLWHFLWQAQCLVHSWYQEATKLCQGRCFVKYDSFVAILLWCRLEACFLVFLGCACAIVICILLSVFRVCIS